MSSSNMGFEDENWDEEFNELQVINDMVLVQKFILENIERETQCNSFGKISLNSTNDFPSIGNTIAKQTPSRNVLHDMHRDKALKKEKLYKQSIQNYFYQEPIMELPQNVEKSWNTFYGELAFTSTVY